MTRRNLEQGVEGVKMFLRWSTFPIERIACFVLIVFFVVPTVSQRPSSKQRRPSTAVLNKYSQLVQAAERGDLNAVRALLRKGVKADPPERGAWTALMSAAKGGHVEVVTALLAAGADPNAVTLTIHAVAFTPLICAFESDSGNNLQVIDALIASGARVNQGDLASPVLRAIVTSNLSMLQALLARGADVNLRFFEGFTPLMIAVDRESTSLVAALIAAGADVNAKNKEGESALSIAERHRRGDIAALLKQAGASP